MKLEVSCAYRFADGFEADLAFTSAHRVTALFGPSGAGKTSLLMAIAGFVVPHRGRIVCDGRVLVDVDAGIFLPPEARRLGVVFQDQRLFPHLSVEANLRFARRAPRRNGGLSFDRLTAVLDLSALLERRPESLSGGERQRVALGRALMSAPELMLLDEPVAAVDEPHRETILEYVERVVHEWNVPMLYVSHHRSEVQRLADWVVALDKGRLTEEGPPERVLGSGAVVAAGEPVNLVRLVDLHAAEDGAVVGVVAASEEATGAAVSLRLPADVDPGGGPLFVEFAASDVMLAAGETAGLSARNRLPATVVELVPRSGRVFVGLTLAGQRLWAEVTADAVDDLGLAAGSEVTCLVKTAALRVVH